MSVRYATISQHKDLVRLSKTSPFTKTFCDVRYIAEYYQRGWIGVTDCGQGFICLRHCSRSTWTTIYYVTVAPEARGKGLGQQLVAWAERDSPHGELRCGVEKENIDARLFWARQGFQQHDVTISKHGVVILQLRRQRGWLQQTVDDQRGETAP